MTVPVQIAVAYCVSLDTSYSATRTVMGLLNHIPVKHVFDASGEKNSY